MKTAKSILDKKFGYSEFRPLQEEIIGRVLDKKDSLVLMPTGGGKSICYQIPALMFDGVAIIVSPLISLMKDQVEALRSNGILADVFNSSLSQEEERAVIDRAIKGQTKLLYLSPERLLSVAQGFLREVNVSMVAIDEAHCVSMWGHDFRPEYTQLAIFRKGMPEVPFIALTATADKTTRKDILKQLGLIDPKTFISSFNRENISLEVRGNVPKKSKMLEISRFVQNRPNDPGIIYCLSRKGAEEMANELKESGVKIAAYHAGLDAETRSKIQEDFINDRIQVISATIAFGMGIDKSNVRFVIHNNLPKNIESFYQEIGRSGRDGTPATSILYYNLRDVMILSQFAKESKQADILLEKLKRMQEFAEARTCRRKILLSYFGEHLHENCGNCDVCHNPPKFFDGSILAQKALSAIKRMDEKVGTTLLIDVLRGSQRQEVIEKGLDKVKTYGAGADVSFQFWQQYITQFLNLGLLEIAYDESFTLKVTEFGNQVLFGQQEIHLTHPVERKQGKGKKRAAKAKLSPDEKFFEKLRELRLKLAKEADVPAYVVFNDATLWEMVHNNPKTELDFLAISGVSEVKLDKYGTEFLREIRKITERQEGTFEVSYRMYKEGLSIQEISTKRELQMTTIGSHFAKLYEDGKDINLEKFVDKKDLDLLSTVDKEINDRKALKPYFEAMKGEVPYYKIRMGFALLG